MQRKAAKKLLATALSMALFLSVMPTGFLNVSAAEGDVNLASWFRMDVPRIQQTQDCMQLTKILKHNYMIGITI
jgi:hypothetical protein